MAFRAFLKSLRCWMPGLSELCPVRKLLTGQSKKTRCRLWLSKSHGKT